MTSKQAYQDKLEAQLHNWNAQIDLLENRSSETDTDQSAAMQYLRKKHDAATRELDKLKNAGEDEWQQLQDELDETWTNLGVAIKSALAKL